MRLRWGLLSIFYVISTLCLTYPAQSIDFGNDFTELFDEDEVKPAPQKEQPPAPQKVDAPKAPVAEDLDLMEMEPKEPEVTPEETPKAENEKAEPKAENENLIGRILNSGKKQAEAVKNKIKQTQDPDKKAKKKKKPQINLLTKMSRNMKFSPDEMRYWIANTPDINACFENGQTVLIMFLTRYTDVRSLNLLIENGADLQTHCTPRYEALLVAAANNPSSAIMETLITNGANMVDYDYENNTALMLAAAFNPSEEVLSLLIDYGLKVEPKNKFGFDALMLASYENGRIPVIQTLLDNQADINAKDPEGHTALMGAAVKGREDVIRYLIFRGADYKAVDKNNLSVLDYYHKRHYLETIATDKPKFNTPSEQLAWEFDFIAKNHIAYNQDLRGALFAEDAEKQVAESLKNLADADTTDSKGCTMLLVAARNNNSYSVFEQLVKARANVSATCAGGKNALMYLATHSDTPETAQENAKIAWLLIENGLDINATDDFGNTALIHAIHNHADNFFIQTLIDAGANLNMVNNNDESALWILVMEERDLETLALLLQSGADANQKNKSGVSPLWYQLNGKRNDDIMKILLVGGADSNELSPSGMQPLWFAFSHAVSADVINEIIAGQVDLNIKNEEGDTPLLYAVKHEYPASVIKLMLHKGANPNIPDAEGYTVYELIRNNPYFKETQQRLTRDKVLEAW